LAPLTSGPTGGEESSSNYVEFMETRVQECLEENKRYFEKYVDMRNFAYQ